MINISEIGHYATRFSKVLRNEGVTSPKMLRPIESRVRKIAQNALGDELFISKIKIPTAAEMTAKSAIEVPKALQKAWDKIIPEIIDKPTETAIVNNIGTGEEIAKSVTNNFTSAHLSQEGIDNVEQSIKRGARLSVIHNHPAECTFSPKDLSLLVHNSDTNNDITAIVTRGGGFGILKKIRTIAPEEIDNNIYKLTAFEELDLLFNAKLSVKHFPEKEKIKKLDEFRNSHIPNIAESLGYKYHYTSGNPNSYTPEMPEFNPLYAMEELRMTTEEFLHKVTTPDIEDFYKPETLNDLANYVKKICESRKKA